MCPVRAGQIIYELGGVNTNLSVKALLNAGTKLPFTTKIIKLVY